VQEVFAWPNENATSGKYKFWEDFKLITLTHTRTLRYLITKCVASLFIQTSSINLALPTASRWRQVSDHCNLRVDVFLHLLYCDDLAGSVTNNTQNSTQSTQITTSTNHLTITCLDLGPPVPAGTLATLSPLSMITGNAPGFMTVTATDTLVVNNSLVIWRHFCLHRPIRQRRLWEHLFNRCFINGLTYLLTHFMHIFSKHILPCLLWPAPSSTSSLWSPIYYQTGWS